MKADLLQCPACGEGHLHVQTRHTTVSHLDQTGVVETHIDVCDECGAELAGVASSRHNKRAVMRFRKQVEGLLAGEEIESFRTTFKLRQEDASAIFGGGPVAFSKYEKNDVAQSVSMDRALRVCRDFPPALFQFAWHAQMPEVADACYGELLDTAAGNIFASGSISGLSLESIRQVLDEAMKSKSWAKPVAATAKKAKSSKKVCHLKIIESAPSIPRVETKYVSDARGTVNDEVLSVNPSWTVDKLKAA